MDYKNKQLMEKIIFKSSFRYHTKIKEHPSLGLDMRELSTIEG
jgi:hypothetical protein